MKNFKKVLSLVLAFAMVLSTMTVAFAATNDDKAEVLYKLGLFKGVSTTEFDPALDQETDAAQAITLIGRALQWEVDEDATVAFTDVPDYAVPYIAYAVDAKITNGVSDTTFGTEYIDGQRMVAWMLRALGYDMTKSWDETDTLAEEAGLTVPENKLRDDVVNVIYEALTTTPVDGDMTLIEKIVGDDAQLRAVAEAEGLMQAVPEDIAVVDVEALNLVQVAVEFNKEVDADTAEDIANYDVKDKTINYAELQEDGKTVVLTLSAAVDQQDKVDVEIEKVEDLDENVIDKVTFEDVYFIDQTLPEVEDVEIVGINTVKVTFTEAVTPDSGKSLKDAFNVEDQDGHKVYVKSSTKYVNASNEQVYVYLSTDLDDVESITLDVDADLEDYAGFSVKANEVSLDVDPDDAKPVVVGYKNAKIDEVTLVFDTDITVESTDDDDIYHTNSKNEVGNDDGNLTDGSNGTHKDYELDGNELTLYFDSNELPEGTAYIYLEDGTVADLWENENDDITVTVEIDVDTVAPVVEDIEVDSQDTLIVTFSENVEDVERSDFYLENEDGDEVKVSSVSTSDDEVTVVFREDLDGDVTLTIDDIEDATGNKLDKTTLDFNVDDETNPDIEANGSADAYDIGDADDQMIRVYFGEEMNTEDDGDYSVANIENYSIFDSTANKEILLSSLDDVDLTVVDDGEAVEISIPKNSDNDNYTVDPGVDKIYIARVKDAADNKTDTIKSELTINNGDNAVVKISDAKLKYDMDDEFYYVEVKFDKVITDFDQDDITLTLDSKAVKASELDMDLEPDGDDSIVTVRFDDDTDVELTAGGSAKLVSGANKIAVTAIGQKSETEYGVKFDTGAANQNISVTDKVAPMVADDGDAVYVYDINQNDKADTIVIEYQENVESSYGVDKNTFEVDGDDVAVTAAVVTNDISDMTNITPADGKYVVLTLDEADVYADRDYIPDVLQVKDIYDEPEGNTADADDAEVVEATSKMGMTVSLTTNTANMVLKLSEALYNANDTAVATGNLTVADYLVYTPTTTGVLNSVAYDASALTLTFTFSMAPANGDTVQFIGDALYNSDEVQTYGPGYTFSGGTSTWSEK